MRHQTVILLPNPAQDYLNLEWVAAGSGYDIKRIPTSALLLSFGYPANVLSWFLQRSQRAEMLSQLLL